MFDFLLAHRDCPWVLPFLPNRISGPVEGGIRKHSNSYSNQIGAVLGLPEDSPPAVWTEAKSHEPATVCLTDILLRDTASWADLFA